MVDKKYKKIIILGAAGSGKTTLSNKISKQTGIQVYHLDKEYWLPNWERPEHSKWLEKLNELVKEDAWIMDGNYIESLEPRLEKADLVIVLDIKPADCVRGIFWRTIGGLFYRRKDLGDGCYERFNKKFAELVEWTKVFKTDYYPYLMKKCFKYNNVDIFIFQSRKGAKKLIKQIVNKRDK